MYISWRLPKPCILRYFFQRCFFELGEWTMGGSFNFISLHLSFPYFCSSPPKLSKKKLPSGLRGCLICSNLVGVSEPPYLLVYYKPRHEQSWPGPFLRHLSTASTPSTRWRISTKLPASRVSIPLNTTSPTTFVPWPERRQRRCRRFGFSSLCLTKNWGSSL